MNRMIAVVAALLLVSTACSDDVSPVCEAREQLQSSVEELRNVNVLDDGLDALRTDLDAVGDDLATFRTEAGDELEPEIDAVRASIDQLRETVDTGGSPADVAASLGAGVSELVTNWNALADAARGLCD